MKMDSTLTQLVSTGRLFKLDKKQNELQTFIRLESLKANETVKQKRRKISLSQLRKDHEEKNSQIVLDSVDDIDTEPPMKFPFLDQSPKKDNFRNTEYIA